MITPLPQKNRCAADIPDHPYVQTW